MPKYAEIMCLSATAPLQTTTLFQCKPLSVLLPHTAIFLFSNFRSSSIPQGTLPTELGYALDLQSFLIASAGISGRFCGSFFVVLIGRLTFVMPLTFGVVQAQSQQSCATFPLLASCNHHPYLSFFWLRSLLFLLTVLSAAQCPNEEVLTIVIFVIYRQLFSVPGLSGTLPTQFNGMSLNMLYVPFYFTRFSPPHVCFSFCAVGRMYVNVYWAALLPSS